MTPDTTRGPSEGGPRDILRSSGGIGEAWIADADVVTFGEGGTYAGMELQREASIGAALGRIGARVHHPTEDAIRRDRELQRRFAWEANDPGCRDINRAWLMCERRASLRRGELRRRRERRHDRRARAAYTAAALVAVGPLIVASLR